MSPATWAPIAAAASSMAGAGISGNGRDEVMLASMIDSSSNRLLHGAVKPSLISAITVSAELSAAGRKSTLGPARSTPSLSLAACTRTTSTLVAR